MKSFKGGIDYEGRILRDQAIRDGYYEPGFGTTKPPNYENNNYEYKAPKKTFKEMCMESKCYLLGKLQSSRKSNLVKITT